MFAYLLQGLPCHIQVHYVVVGVGAGIGGSELQSPTQHFTRTSHYLLLNHLSIWLNAAVVPLSSLALGFPGGSDSKESACNAGDLASIPGLGRSSGGRHAKLL